MRLSHFMALLGILLSAGAQADPFAVPPDYTVGLLVSLDTGGPRTVVRISAQGTITAVGPEHSQVTFAPQLNFSIDETGTLRSFETTFGGKVQLMGGLGEIAAAAKMVIDANGLSWLVVPQSTLASAESLSKKLHSVVESLQPVVVRAPPEHSADSNGCSRALATNFGDTPSPGLFKLAVNPLYDTTVLAAWSEYHNAHPDQK